MTDRLNALVVTFDRDIREDDAQALIDAIKQFKHVIDVTGNVSDMDSHIAYARARNVLGKKIWDALHGDKFTDQSSL